MLDARSRARKSSVVADPAASAGERLPTRQSASGAPLLLDQRGSRFLEVEIKSWCFAVDSPPMGAANGVGDSGRAAATLEGRHCRIPRASIWAIRCYGALAFLAILGLVGIGNQGGAFGLVAGLCFAVLVVALCWWCESRWPRMGMYETVEGLRLVAMLGTTVVPWLDIREFETHSLTSCTETCGLLLASERVITCVELAGLGVEDEAVACRCQTGVLGPRPRRLVTNHRARDGWLRSLGWLPLQVSRGPKQERRSRCRKGDGAKPTPPRDNPPGRSDLGRRRARRLWRTCGGPIPRLQRCSLGRPSPPPPSSSCRSWDRPSSTSRAA
jgi:hypothetical protein